MAISAPAGVAVATSRSVATAAGQHIDSVAQQHQQLTAGQNIVLNAGDEIGLFAHGGDMRHIAHQGEVLMQAQHNDIKLQADQGVEISASQQHVSVGAKQHITLLCGGAYLKIGGGNIELGMPGNFTVKAANHELVGPASLSHSLPNLPGTEPTTLEIEHLYGNGEPVPNAPYRATFADGSVRSGVLDAAGKASLSDVPGASAVIEYFEDPRDIEQKPQAWPYRTAAEPVIQMLHRAVKNRAR